MKNENYPTRFRKNSLPQKFKWNLSLNYFFISSILLLTVFFGETLAQTVVTFPSSSTWTAPAGVTSIQVEAWGGGGGGGGTGVQLGANAGGGGGGGAYAKTTNVTVVPLTTYTVTVSTGGTAGTSGGGTGGAGGASSFNTTTVVAAGGAGGGGSNATLGGNGAAGAGATVAASTGATKFAGGAGAAGQSSTGGGGGGSAGTASAGNAAVGAAGGVAVTGGGAGGAGTSAAGSAGSVPGGAGGGGRSAGITGTARAGGAGAAGRVVVTYTLPTVTGFGASSGCIGGSITITGTNFTGAIASGVKIGGTAVTSITSNTGTQIVAVIGSGTTGTVSVTVNGNTGTSAGTFTVNPTPVLTATPSGQTACDGVAFSGIALGSSVGGTSFSWASNSPAGIGGAPISGSASPISGTFTNSNTVATNVTFTINGSAAGCNAVPITATVTVNPSTLISSQPSAQTICQTQNATFTVGATGVGLTYQWQEQVGGAGAFNNISNGGVYGGATSASLVLTSPSLSMSTNVYQCIVTGTCGSATTSTALLTINPTPVISVSPTTQTLCADFPIADIVFSDINGASSGSSTFSYSRTTPGGIGGTVPVSGTASPISGTFTSTNSVPTTVTFTITASLGSCNAIPVTADVIVNPGVAINTQPSDQTICQTYDATFTIAVAGGGITYQWQEQVGGVGAFSDIINGGVYSGATSNALLLTNPAIGMSTNRYRCTINSSCGALTSDDKLLTINPTPAVTALPSSQTICSGSSISNIVLTDNNGLTVGSTFSWTAVYDANVSGSMGASGSSDITGTVSNTNLSSSANATYTITGTFGSCTSHPITATVTVNPQTIISVQPVDHTICETQSTSFSVTATGLGITYQWQEQIGAGAFADISNGGAYGGATTPTLTLTNPAQSLTGNHYHCVISNTGACPQVTTNNVLLTINYTPLPVATPSSQTVCSGASVNIGLTDNNPVSSGTTYSWTRNSPAGISGNASGTGSISEVYTNSNPSTSATITFTINATTPASCPAIPITATATINPNVLITSQPVSATRCSNTSSATFTVSATGLPTLTYQWQEQVGGVGAFNDISNGGVYGGATTVTLSLTNPPIGMSTNHYRCIVSGTCGPATSDGNATLIINPQPIVTVTPSPGLNCSGGGSTLTASSSVGGTSYVWSPTTALNPAAGTSAIEIASPTVATTYTVTGTATGCSGSTTVTVNVGTNPSAVTVTPVSSTICPGDVKQLTASGGTNAVSGTLLDGTVAGGFENATSTFAANGWTQVGTTAPTWFVGTAGGAQNGTKSAFYGSSATTYGTASSTSTVNHFYRDIPIPAGATNVLLNYYYKMPTVDDGFDYFYVYTGSSAGAVPSAGSLPSGYTQQFSNTTTAYSSFTAMTAINLTSFAGSTVRIIFSFQTDAASPYANPAIDNVSLTATVPPTVNPFTWSPTTGLFTNAGGTIPYTGTTTTTVYASPSSTTTYTATAANAAGCTSSGTAVVNFSTAPPTISSYSTACTGQTLTINGNNFINVTSATVGGIAATPTIVNNTQLTLTVPAGASGTNVVVTLTSNCGTATDNTLTVNTTPTVTATPSSQTICTGATIAPIVLSNTNAIPGAVISWSRTSPSGTGGTVATSGSGSSPVTISGVFTSTNASSLPIPFSYNCSANGCTSTGSATVTMSAALAGVVASASPAAVCAGSPTSLSSTAPTVPTSPILTQNFNSTPVGWTTTNSSSGGTPANAAWTLRADAYSICYLQIIICLQSVIWHSNDNSQFYMSNSDAQAGTTTSTQLTSPSFSTVGLTNASLSFWHYFLQNTSADHGRVEVSTDGGTIWTVLQDNNSTQGTPTTNSGTTVFVNQVVSLNTVLNQPNVKIRFNYTASDGWFWCIDNVSITGTPGTRTFSWTSSPAGFTSTSQNPGNATPTVSPTIYSVTTTLAGACAVSNVSVTRLPLPSVAASNDAPFCSGAQDLHLTSTAPTATSYQWTGPEGYSSASANPTITNAPSSASGNYQLKVTDSNGCKDSIITAVNIYALPSIGVTVIGSPNLCTGQTTSDLQATGAGGSGSYSWTTGETTDLITVSSAGTYIVTGTDNHSCVNTFSQVITETAAPAAPVVTPVGPVTLCFNSGGVIPVTLTCTNYSSDLLWSTSETTSGISVDYEDIFNVTYTDANGCYSVSNSVTTSFDAVLPVITCPSDVVSCSTTPALGTPTTSDNCSVASVTNDAPSVFPVGTTSVTWTVTDYNSNSATCVQQVTVNSAAVIGACPSDITQCDNHVATWTTPSASGAPTPTVSCTPASGSTFGAGTTSVTCTASNTCGSSSCSFNVTINETPIIGACPSDITTCNPVVTFSTPSATATPSATVTCVPASGSSFALGTTVVTCTATNLCGSSSCTFNISVQTPSTAATSATSNALYGQVCLNGSVILTANGGSLGTGASWVWYEGGCGSGASIGTGASITITPLTNGSHIYYVRAEGACGNTVCQSVTIDVISTPPSGTIHYTAGLADGCVGAPAAAISVNAVANCTFYNWASNQAGVLFNGNPGPYQTTTPTVNVSFTSLPVSGNSGWSICVFGGNACGNTNNVCTWVRATLSTPTSVTGSVVGCPGSGGNAYSSATVAGAASYQWTGSAGVTVTGNGSQSVTVAFSAGFISGTLSVHGQTACGYNGADRTITITRAPVLPGAISGTSYPCPSASASYSVTAVPGAATYTWTTSVAGAIVSGTTNTCTILFPAAIPAGSTVSVTANSSCPFSSPVRSKGIASGMPNVPGNIGGPASGQCAQTGVSYSIGPVANATSYSWSTTCGTIQGPNNLSGITVDWASNMTNCTISVVSGNACGNSAPRTLLVTGAPSTPTTISGNISVCAGATEQYCAAASNGANAYQWTVPAGAVIVGPSNGVCILVTWGSTGGTLICKALNDCGVSGSKTQAVAVTCRQSQMDAIADLLHAEVYPNPTTGKLTVKFSSNSSEKLLLNVLDVAGRILVAENVTANEGVNLHELDLSTFAKGIYLVQLRGESRNEAIRVTVE